MRLAYQEGMHLCEASKFDHFSERRESEINGVPPQTNLARRNNQIGRGHYASSYFAHARIPKFRSCANIPWKFLLCFTVVDKQACPGYLTTCQALLYTKSNQKLMTITTPNGFKIGPSMYNRDKGCVKIYTSYESPCILQLVGISQVSGAPNFLSELPP